MQSLCAYLALGAAWCLIVGSSRANQAPGQTTPKFRTGIDIVQIDVTVLNSEHKPVRGLLREDFTLLEDGEPQEILGFGEVNIPDASDGPEWLRDSHPDVRTADDGRVLIFLLDDAQTPDDLKTKARLETVKRIAAEVIDRLGPTDVAAVICTYDKRCAQDFTNDRALLKAAVARFTPKQFPVEGGYDWYRQSGGVAGSLVKYLIEQPGRRKAIIYVTPRQPTRPLEWPHPAGSLAANVTAQQMIRTFESAMRARVTVYGMNSSGLVALGENDSAGLVTPPHAHAVPEVPSVGATSRFSAAPRSLAAETGGFTIRDPSQFAEGVAQIFRETGSYYLLGYEQPSKKDTGYNMLGGFRSIEVRVNRPALQVKTHRGYIAPKPEKPPSNPPPPASAALAGILPKADLPLRVAVAPFAVPRGKSGKPETALAIVLGVREPTPSGRTTDRLELQFRAFTQRGDPRGMKTDQTNVVIPSGREGEVLLETLSELRLKPGVYALRFSASSERLGKEGSVYADVEVPDFAMLPLSLSGVLLTSMPRPSVAPTDALAALVPVVPTTLREFGVTHRVSAFLRVYQGGKRAPVPVTLTARVLNAASAVVADHSETLAAASFDTNRAVDYQYQVPLVRLAPGLHLLRIQATAGASTVQRDVRFTVK